ncbi:MAG: hypothetical protein COA77_09070 [Thaumarchaeota archaeon]|nr:MAG: hypothetical protein COA77_09070 [Nitrososphaerota archaeon]
MNKKIAVIPIIIIVIVFAINFSSDSNVEKSNNVFHITLADPNLYTNGVYFDEFTISKGEYSFSFVPNGSSPKILSIKLNGDSFDFSEDFKLEGTLHQTGISEYYTWNYNGERNILILEEQEILISINPNGNVMGSVSVDILEN